MNFIHPTSIIDSNVTLGKNNYIGPFCYITGNTIIGNDNRFEAYCSIGTPAQDRSIIFNNQTKQHSVIIGNNNVFREHCQVHTGTKTNTIIKNNCLFLVNSHISHDSTIEDKVTIGNNSILGGHVIIMEGANIALGVIIHQFSKIGAYSMLGMGCIVTKTSQITPGNIYIGNPAKYLKENKIGLERNQITQDKLNQLINEYEKL